MLVLGKIGGLPLCFDCDLSLNNPKRIYIYQSKPCREHNRIAKTLGLANPGWKDEQLFSQARRIITAQLQVGGSLIHNMLVPVRCTCRKVCIALPFINAISCHEWWARLSFQ